MTDTEQTELVENEEDDIRFHDDPESKFRIYSVISYFIVLVIIGIPVWWHTTRVYRAPLPLDEMSNVKIPLKTIRQNSIPLSLEYDILVTLVNPDPNNLKLDLDAKDLFDNMGSFIDIMSPIANFTFKSQWLYLVNLLDIQERQGNKLDLHEEDLPLIITPLEKKIWSHMSSRPTLNLVIYVTQCHVPIHIQSKFKEKVFSNAFLSPRWGGIIILNPDTKSCEEKMYTPNLRTVVGTIISQLYDLMGLRSDTKDDILMMKIVKVREMVDSTRRTLKSLAQLLSEINSIVIKDDIAEKINLALYHVNEAEQLLRSNKVDKALIAAKIAYKNSEEAFVDPSLLALLYFPDDQKYAVYIPLFLPIMIPVFMSLTTIKRYFNTAKPKQD